MSKSHSGLISLIALLTITAPPALAQLSAVTAKDYPSKPIRLVIPFAVGGGTDITARMFAQRLIPGLRQNIVFDNRGGAGGMIGVDVVAKSAPDGYTLLFMSSAYTTLPYFYKNLPYDPVRDLRPITLVGKNFGQVLAVNPSLPVRSVREFVALAKANPGKLDYGAAGMTHLATEHFSMLAGIKMNHVPYKGGGPAIIDVISGQIQVILPAAQSVVTHIRSGRLRALAITGEERWSQLPNVPTLEESGIKGYKLVPWYGLWFPAGTRVEYVDRIQSEVAKALKDREAKRLFEEQGLKGVGSSAEDLEEAIQEEFTLVRKLTTMTGIVPQ
ncbi:MAG: hypothetical protein A3G24_06320 [Betaproteobacteria bacterium RIFCSPLOWO2_12_FULL_62_13]|nr:MAG: hypothetical protein A3G24_06320 [Betaproteobacteria bacterium RIFCSPLOWO2_12_FULL_62_13]